MAHPIFGSAQQKLIRADAHLRDLVEREKAFLESKPYVQVEEADPERPGHRVRKIKLSKVLDPVFADVVADAVINYRTVLDHAAYAVAVAAGEPEPKDAYFPISRTNAAGLDNVIRGRCKDLPWQISDFFRKLKPYPGGNDALVALNTLCNTQKHALVAPVAAVASTVAASIEGNGYFSMPRPHVWAARKTR